MSLTSLPRLCAEVYKGLRDEGATDMLQRLIVVRANWDEDASVWVATSHDVPGLVTEADTLEQLRDKLLAIIPEERHLEARYLS